MFGYTGPKAALGFLFSEKRVGLDETIRITSFAIFERDGVHHAVAVKGVITLYWLE